MFASRTQTIRAGLVAALLLAMLFAFPAGAADVKLPELKTRNATFTNVTITGRTENDIYIRHERGIGNVKIADIEDDAALIALGLKAAPSKEGGEAAPANLPFTNAILARIVGTNQPLQMLMKSPAWVQAEKLRDVEWTWKLASMVAGGFLLIFLFSSFCMRLICVKAGYQPGALVWIPLLQMIPMFKAAGMSGWWLLGMFVPILNLVGWIMWAFKITQVRGKSVVVAIALLLPVLGLFAFLYLAFSDAADSSLKVSVKQ